MHWSDEIADKLIARNPDKEEYVCAAGISPSGSIHIGNFRDIATSLFVVKALQRKGKKARLLFSWDEYDRIRKIPKNVMEVNPGMEEYIGVSYVDAPDPFGTGAGSYAAYFEKEFEESIKRFGIDLDYRYQGSMNRSGKYADYVILALQKRGEIFDILDSFRTQAAVEGERESYYPASIYCPACHKDTTRITMLSEDCCTAEYECKCGHKGIFDFRKDFHCKLAWKVDWPMRWKYEEVDFEPGGKDHASPGGSYDTSRVIAEKIFGYQAPLFQGYEFVGIKGTTGKMSGSTGLNLTPATLLNIYQPQVILWLYARAEPNKAFDFCFDDGILRQYFEFDRQYNQYRDGTADDHVRGIMESCLAPGDEIQTVPMSHLVQLGSIVDFNVPMVETVFEKIGTPYKYEQFKDRLALAKFWLENCAPENVNRLRTTRNWEVYEALDDKGKEEIRLLHGYLAQTDYSLDELNAKLYAIPKEVYGEQVENLKAVQGAFFRSVYQLLLDKTKGPRLYLFLYAIDKEQFLGLLDFSYPETEEERLQTSGQQNAGQGAAQQTSGQQYGAVSQDAAQFTPGRQYGAGNQGAAYCAPGQQYGTGTQASGQDAPLQSPGQQCGAGISPSIVYGEPDPVAPIKAEIDIEKFSELDLRVCKILKCTEIRKSHSCYKLTLFDGTKERVIVSSIKKYYTPEQMIGKKIIVVANLKPARFSGVTSEGMLLAATNNACGCQVIFVDDGIPEGTAVC